MTKVAVVTGATGGVGRATVRELARRGYDIGLLARGRAGLEAASAEVTAMGRRACAVPTDVADFEQVDAAGSRVEAELGPINAWVNNAMTTVFASVVDVEPGEIRRATEVTYLGQVHGAMAALSRMRPRDRGVIVSVGSALAFRGIPLQSAYCGSKFAVRGFMESLRGELLAEHSAIRVCQVHLPAVNTTQFGWCRSRMPRHPMPVPPIYQPEVPARAIVRIIDSGARRDVVGAWTWLMIQLNQLMPGVGDHYMAQTGIDSQQTDIPISADRPDDLEDPVDDDADHGAHGIFDECADGLTDPSFLTTLPTAALKLAKAAGGRAAEVFDTRVRARLAR